MRTSDKHIPHPSDLDLEYFRAGAATGTLHIQKCSDCGDFHHPPRMYCPQCYSAAYIFEQVGGRGTIYSYTVSHYTTEKAWRAEVPWITLVVQLAEGPRLVGTGRGFNREEVQIGRTVQVVTETVNDEFTYLWVEKDD